jgi:ribonuclease HI
MHEQLEPIKVYTDGAAHPNPNGRGGFGVIIIQGGRRRELSGGFRKTTNNRMELVAVIEALKALEGSGLDITIFTDSKYVGDMFNGGYVEQWKSKGWMLGSKKPAKNPDLWHQLLELSNNHNVRFEWIRSHDGHPENERCDQLAVEARRRDDLPADEGFENPYVPEIAMQRTLWDVMQ